MSLVPRAALDGEGGDEESVLVRFFASLLNFFLTLC